MISCKQLDYAEIPFLSTLGRDYVLEPEKLKDFYKFPPNQAGLAQAIENRKSFSTKRDLLADSLLKRYEQLGLKTKEVQSRINKLRENNTFTVTTGHQLSLFTGPLYFIYKIISAINLAQKVEQEHGNITVLPVFWMASEDHDFPEISHFYAQGQRFDFKQSFGGYCGDISTDGLEKIEDQLEHVLPKGKRSEQLLKLFNKCYVESENLAEATFKLVAKLFEHTSLLILDANDNSLKESFIPYFERDLKGENFDSIKEKTNELAFEGYHAQVEIKEINTFLLQDDVRVRIEKQQGDYALSGTSIRYTSQDLYQKLHENPAVFSPNVMLRPLYQEVILPNLAYIGGAAEVAYWMQLRSMFAKNNVPFPVVFLRDSALWLSKRATQKLKECQLGFIDLFHSAEQHISNYVKLQGGDKLELGDSIKQLQSLYDSIEKQAVEIDETLKFPTRGYAKKAENGLLALQKKMFRAEKKKQHVFQDRVYAVYEEAFPEGVFQERKTNFADLFLTHGDAFFESCFEHFDVLSPGIRVFYEE